MGLASRILLLALLLFAGGALSSGCADAGCASGQCTGSDGACYGPCTSSGAVCTSTPSGSCSAPSPGGIYCCVGGGGGGGGGQCNSGYCLNNGKCCPRSTPDYTYGGHGYSAGCYASCPYVGDCGASTQCF